MPIVDDGSSKKPAALPDEDALAKDAAEKEEAEADEAYFEREAEAGRRDKPETIIADSHAKKPNPDADDAEVLCSYRDTPSGCMLGAYTLMNSRCTCGKQHHSRCQKAFESECLRRDDEEEYNKIGGVNRFEDESSTCPNCHQFGDEFPGLAMLPGQDGGPGTGGGQQETASPTDSSVAWKDLWKYPNDELNFEAYYVLGVSTPLVLTVAMIGATGALQPERIAKNEHVLMALSRGSGGLFSNSQILPTNRSTGKKNLLKEAMRRHLVRDTRRDPEADGSELWSNLKIASKSIPKLVDHLTDHPPPLREVEFIIKCWGALVESIEEHYLEQSGGSEAVTFRHCRWVE